MRGIGTAHIYLLETLAKAIMWPVHFDFCFFKSTASPLELARMHASRWPCGDHANVNMRCSSKCVSCCGAEPLSGIDQILETPLGSVRTVLRALASRSQRTGIR